MGASSCAILPPSDCQSTTRQRKSQGDDAPAIGTTVPLTFRLLSPIGGKGGAATVVTFTLNQAAQVTARVLSPAGKMVRQWGA